MGLVAFCLHSDRFTEDEIKSLSPWMISELFAACSLPTVEPHLH